MGPNELLNTYGPAAGLIIIIALAVLPAVITVVKALGLGQAAKVTAGAEVIHAQADVQRVEAETQRGMNKIATQMLDEQRAFYTRHDALNTEFGDLKVKFAEMSGEYRAYRESQAEIVGSLKQQISITEDLRHSTEKHNERLEIEVQELRDQVGKMQLALDTVNAISEDRKKENEALRATNHTLEKKEAEYLKRIDELEAKIRLLEEKNQELNQRIEQLEAAKPRLEDEPAVVEQPELVAEGEIG